MRKQKFLSNTSNSLTIRWKALGLEHCPSGKKILSNLNGQVTNGEFLCIMGQSGAGKSSFLSLLTARITTNNREYSVQGNIQINEEDYNFQEFGQIAAYVRQDDILMQALTVKETFEFQANLRLHYMNRKEKQEKCQSIIGKLNLKECQNSLVGGQFAKSISGGQRKRVAIGIELLANPGCLVLDEPTSGLDSHNAYKIMTILRELTEEGKLIITTLHQPSTLMFGKMDKILLLGEGQTLYMGKARKIVQYMQNLRIQINYQMNPADFFMLQVSQFKKQSGYTTPMTVNNFLVYRRDIDSQSAQNRSQQSFLGQLNPSVKSMKMASFIVQFRYLFLRSLKKFYRTPSNISGKMISIVVVPLYMATLYHGIGNEVPPLAQLPSMQDYLTELAAFLFMTVFFNFSMNTFDTVLTCKLSDISVAEQKQIALKENSARLYSLHVYFWARCLVELPISLFVSLVSSCIIYFVAALETQFFTWVKFSFIMLEVSFAGLFLGLLIGLLFRTEASAGQFLPIIIMPIVVFGGLVVSLDSIPSYSSWIQYLSPVRHAYSAVMIDQLSTPKMHNIINVFPDLVRRFVGINGQMTQNMIYEGILLMGFALSSIVCLYLKRKAL